MGLRWYKGGIASNESKGGRGSIESNDGKGDIERNGGLRVANGGRELRVVVVRELREVLRVTVIKE